MYRTFDGTQAKTKIKTRGTFLYQTRAFFDTKTETKKPPLKRIKGRLQDLKFLQLYKFEEEHLNWNRTRRRRITEEEIENKTNPKKQTNAKKTYKKSLILGQKNMKDKNINLKQRN